MSSDLGVSEGFEQLLRIMFSLISMWEVCLWQELSKLFG